MYVSGRIFPPRNDNLIYFILFFKLRENNSRITNKINLLFNFVLGHFVFAE